jgi:hypothetical protein
MMVLTTSMEVVFRRNAQKKNNATDPVGGLASAFLMTSGGGKKKPTQVNPVGIHNVGLSEIAPARLFAGMCFILSSENSAGGRNVLSNAPASCAIIAGGKTMSRVILLNHDDR